MMNSVCNKQSTAITAITMNTTILLAGQAVLIVAILVAVKFRAPITNTVNRLISAILRVSIR